MKFGFLPVRGLPVLGAMWVVYLWQCRKSTRGYPWKHGCLNSSEIMGRKVL